MILTDKTVTYTLAEVTLCSLLDAWYAMNTNGSLHEQQYWPLIQQIIDLCHQQRLSEQREKPPE